MDVFGLMTLLFLGVPVLLALSAMWKGYVISVLWGWFVVPAFGLPPLSVPLAIGVALIVTLMTHQNPARQGAGGGKKDDLAHAMWFAALLPLFGLGIGWVAKQFI